MQEDGRQEVDEATEERPNPGHPTGKAPLRYRREALGFTQLRLSRRSGVSQRTINSIEHGGRCRRDTKRKLLIALGLTMDELAAVFPEGDSDD